MYKLIIKTLPVSVNQRYTIARGQNILSKKYREAKEAIQWEIAAQFKGEILIEDGIAVNIMVYYSGKRPDIDAYEKLLLDSMTGIVYKDDGLIDEKHTFRTKIEKDPYIEIHII
jgi:Holliday junction resolvase RusA-like endonuclease